MSTCACGSVFFDFSFLVLYNFWRNTQHNLQLGISNSRANANLHSPILCCRNFCTSRHSARYKEDRSLEPRITSSVVTNIHKGLSSGIRNCQQHPLKGQKAQLFDLVTQTAIGEATIHYSDLRFCKWTRYLRLQLYGA